MRNLPAYVKTSPPADTSKAGEASEKGNVREHVSTEVQDGGSEKLTVEAVIIIGRRFKGKKYPSLDSWE